MVAATHNDAMTSTKRPNNHETLSMTLAMLDMIPKIEKSATAYDIQGRW